MRIAVMNTNVFNTIIAAVKGAVSTSARKPMYEYIRLEFRRENKAVTAIATDGCRLFVEHATCFEIEEDFDCYIKPSVRLPRGQDMRLELKERSKTESAVEIECLGCIFGFVQPVGEFLDWEKVLPDADVPHRCERRVSSLGVAGGKGQRRRHLQAACYSGIPRADCPHYDQDQPQGRQNGPAGAHQGGGQWL